MSTMDFRWSWCVNVGSSAVTNVAPDGKCWQWGVCTCPGAGDRWVISSPSSQFLCEPKSALKKEKKNQKTRLNFKKKYVVSPRIKCTFAFRERYNSWQSESSHMHVNKFMHVSKFYLAVVCFLMPTYRYHNYDALFQEHDNIGFYNCSAFMTMKWEQWCLCCHKQPLF